MWSDQKNTGQPLKQVFQNQRPAPPRCKVNVMSRFVHTYKKNVPVLIGFLPVVKRDLQEHLLFRNPVLRQQSQVDGSSRYR